MKPIIDTPRRGSKHIARGRAKRHPGCYTNADYRPERAKALNINHLHYVYVMLLPFQGAEVCSISKPGVPLRSAPGYVLAAPAGRAHKRGASYAKKRSHFIFHLKFPLNPLTI